ncbi:MAG: primosomal protein N' [Spirochaetes bacterium]|nr:primosomal protein N' [Spirochaetota bacterium]
MYVEVVFNIPLKTTFHYTIPEKLAEDNIKTGMRVSAQLKNRKLTGFVVSVSEKLPTSGMFSKDIVIKDIERIIDKEPLFDESYYSLARWVSGMYMCSEGEALFSMIPSGRREKDFDIDIAEEGTEDFTHITLNKAQKSVIEKIRCIPSESRSNNSLFYLYGVTGSGKTEVYLQIAEDVLAQGKSVIYLVPEIALTHQLMDYVTARFGKNIAVLHSGLTPSQRLKQWRKIQSGDAKVVLGARSAVFAPVKNLGLIIIDEEHEATYKSGSTPRYHARQVAMYRIKAAEGKLIMGSATPSVEAYHLMADADAVLEKCELPEIAAGGTFAPVKIIDMKNESSAISSYLAERIREITSKKGQVILFLNRRGFFYYYHCLFCRYEFKCRQCSVSLTYHKERNKLLCHYCGYSETPLKICPSCGSSEVGYSGFGTEKIESDINTLFPYLKSQRLDKDSIKKSSSAKEIFAKFKNRETDLLLGTQIIAKGLNFPGVKLIGIIMADTTLQLPDFRSAEKTYSLITQVAGRTGRFSKDGEVVIQTYRPDNYAIKFAGQRKEKEFYKTELENRKIMGFPPFSRVIRVIFRSKENEKALKAANDFSDILVKYKGNFNILGPAECPLAVIAGNSRYHILVMSKDIKNSHAIVRESAEKIKSPFGVYIEIDVDPVSLM